MTPFRAAAAEADLVELRARLKQARWPEPQPVDGWSQGVPLAYLQELCRNWAETYDWRSVEARLNAVPQFRTVIDGLGAAPSLPVSRLIAAEHGVRFDELARLSVAE